MIRRGYGYSILVRFLPILVCSAHALGLQAAPSLPFLPSFGTFPDDYATPVAIKLSFRKFCNLTRQYE